MRSALLAALAAICSGCAMTPQELATRSTGSLCVSYARAILNSNRGAWLEEVYRRGETCAPYATEMVIAARESQQTLNSLNTQLGVPASPVAAPAGRTITAFLRTSREEGMNRICVYDALGSPYVITLKAAQICPVSTQVQR